MNNSIILRSKFHENKQLMIEYSLKNKKKIYFASDFHLGGNNFEQSRKRELLIIRWLDEIKEDAQIIFLVGDIFDIWFEYDLVVPKGYVRFLGKIAELVDLGIEIKLFRGNHDLWQLDYFEKEIGVSLHRNPFSFKVNNHSFYVHHGDRMGDVGLKFHMMKFLFDSEITNWLFRKIMPTQIGLKLGLIWADYSWKKVNKETHIHPENWDLKLVDFIKKLNSDTPHNFFIFGHWHLMNDKKIDDSARYINLGDWIIYNSYAVFDGQNLALKQFTNE